MPVRTCRECFEEYVPHPKARNDDGFCSDPCEAQYDQEIMAGEHPAVVIGPDLAKLIESIERRVR
jgi:hypothetical protein